MREAEKDEKTKKREKGGEARGEEENKVAISD